MNGKGSAPRNNWSQQFRDNYSLIEWNPMNSLKKFAPRKRRGNSASASRSSSNSGSQGKSGTKN